MGELAVGWIATVLLSDNMMLMLGMFGAIGLLEWAVPAVKIPPKHYKFNLAYSLVTIPLATVLTPLVAAGLAVGVKYLGFGLFDLRRIGLDGIAGALFALGVGTLIHDFFFYWMHRFQHENSVMWQEHLLHHCDEYVNVTSAPRSHVLDIFILPIFVAIPTAVLFDLPAITIGWLSLVPTAWNYFTHANVKIGFGPLWWLVVSPSYHRIHHSLDPRHIDTNFAEYFPVWDIIFGTVRRPRAGDWPATGVADVHVTTLAEAYLQPIRGWLGLISPGWGRAVLPARPRHRSE